MLVKPSVSQRQKKAREDFHGAGEARALSRDGKTRIVEGVGVRRMGVGARDLPDVEAPLRVAEQRADGIPRHHVVDRVLMQAALLLLRERVAGEALGVEHGGAGVLRDALGVEGHVAALGMAGEQQGAFPAIRKGAGGGVLHRPGQRGAEVVAPVHVRGDAGAPGLRAAHGDDGGPGRGEGVGDKAGAGVVVLIGEDAQFRGLQRGKERLRVLKIRAAGERAEGL